jgi:hypothetical protein
MIREYLKAEWRGEVESRGEVNNLLHNPGDTVLVRRGHPRIIAIQCPCGCGDQIIINLDKQAGPAWRFFQNGTNKQDFTLFPSVWRETGCESHFIVWHGQIIGAGYRPSKQINQVSYQRVQSKLAKIPQNYLQIAEELQELPWTVLWVCEDLVRQGVAEGNAREGNFAIAKRSY